MTTISVVPLWFGGVTGISNVADISALGDVVGIVMPADWTPAILTLEVSPDGENFYPLYDGMNIMMLSIEVPPGAIIPIRPDRLRCCKMLRLVSGTRAKLVPQGEPREFGLVVEAAS